MFIWHKGEKKIEKKNEEIYHTKLNKSDIDCLDVILYWNNSATMFI
jgi:hypothetical protein